MTAIPAFGTCLRALGRRHRVIRARRVTATDDEATFTASPTNGLLRPGTSFAESYCPVSGDTRAGRAQSETAWGRAVRFRRAPDVDHLAQALLRGNFLYACRQLARQPRLQGAFARFSASDGALRRLSNDEIGKTRLRDFSLDQYA